MKNMLFLLPLFFLFVACEDDDNAITPDGVSYACTGCDTSMIAGTWRLAEFYSDPGDGSGAYAPYESNKEVTFAADGTFAATGDLCSPRPDGGEATNGTYDLPAGELRAEGCAVANPVRMIFGNGRLTISYFCIEGCGERYRKISD